MSTSAAVPELSDEGQPVNLDQLSEEDRALLLDSWGSAPPAPAPVNGHGAGGSSQPRRVETLADILETPMPEVTSLPFLGRDNVVVEGWSHLLASAPRVGKTELLCQVMIPWLRLGKRILWLSEEARSLWKDRIEELAGLYGSRIPWDLVQYHPTIGAAPKELLELAQASEAAVVVADTLRHVAGMRDENDAAEVRRTVAPWVSGMAGRTFIALTHHRKGAGDNGGERVAGSVAIVGLFDVILELERDKDSPCRRRLSGRSRRHEVPSVVVERDDDGRMVVLGDGRSVSRQEADKRILATVNAAGELLTTRQIQQAMGAGAPSIDTVARSLQRLAHLRSIRRYPEIDEDASGQRVKWSAFDLFE